MLTDSVLREKLVELANQQLALQNKGGPFEDGKLFEQILVAQEFILNKFGLPNTSEHERLLFFKSLPSGKEVDYKINELHKTATEYLLSKGKSEIQILKDAQDLQQDAYVVLPELKMTTHIYTCFVYDKILLEQKDTIENILEDLKFVNNYNTLNQIWEIVQAKDEDKSKFVEDLKLSNIKYINQFLEHYFNL